VQAPAWALWLAGHGFSFMNTQGQDSASLTRTWDQVLLVYCFVASITPMWVLLQPRGVIGGTFLYAALFFGICGTLIGGWSAGSSLAIQYPAFTGFISADGMSLFPFLFIIIACGACSGFHSIVASGTTCKQIRTEADARPVAYGAMLLEAMVAVFALTCVMVLPAGSKTAAPDIVYARGLGNFMSLCGIPMQFAVGFGLLAFSSFVFDTMDVCTRLGRYVMQELIGIKGIFGGVVATLITLSAPSVYLYLAPPGAFKTFWVIFGTSNQLLAALTLVGVSVWLWKTGRPVWFALLPAIFMLASTGTALVMNLRTFYTRYLSLGPEQVQTLARPLQINMGLTVGLLFLSLLVVGEAIRVWHVARKYRIIEPVKVSQ
jgi:carbon starvation protein